MTLQYDPTLGLNLHSESVAASTTSTPIPINGESGKVSVAVHPSGGTGRVEFSLSSNAISAPGSANWVAWAGGDVSASTADTLDGPVVAVRCVSGAGATTVFEVAISPRM